jgi:2-keto-4-pentenoate hydratase/2-oxohepta-3-ene-1,7-dioic acid hydratase (catechol pathway)
VKLVTFDDGKVGRVEGDVVTELAVDSMREYFESGFAERATGQEYALGDVKLRAPIIPKKFFHTAGNFREHEEESKNVDWSHEIAPWIMFFQNVDAIIGPDEPVVYPEHLTEELDYELELAVVIKKAGKWFSPEEAADYIGGYVIFNDITARDIQRREMRSGVFSFCKAIDTFCPLGPWIVTPDEIPDPHDLKMELRVNGESRQVSHSGNMSGRPGDPFALLGARLQRGRRGVNGDGQWRRRLQRGCRVALSEARRRDRGGDRADRRASQPGRVVAGSAWRAGAGARAMVSVALLPFRFRYPPPRVGLLLCLPASLVVDVTRGTRARLCQFRAKTARRQFGAKTAQRRFGADIPASAATL